MAAEINNIPYKIYLAEERDCPRHGTMSGLT